MLIWHSTIMTISTVIAITRDVNFFLPCSQSVRGIQSCLTFPVKSLCTKRILSAIRGCTDTLPLNQPLIVVLSLKISEQYSQPQMWRGLSQRPQVQAKTFYFSSEFLFFTRTLFLKILDTLSTDSRAIINSLKLQKWQKYQSLLNYVNFIDK